MCVADTRHPSTTVYYCAFMHALPGEALPHCMGRVALWSLGCHSVA